MSQRLESRTERRTPRASGPRPLDPGMALLPLRLFLGITFVYAGIQKLSDPGFLHPGAGTYIGTQLNGFAHGTPGGFLLRFFATSHPEIAGVAVALLEIAIGLLVTAGLLTRIAAAAGLALNLVLFLTNSWNAYPYFLGSDIVFVFAWLPLVLAGAAGQPALDNSLHRLARSPRLRIAPAAAGDPPLSRREVLQRTLGVAGLMTLALGGLAALSKGSYRGTARTLGSSGSRGAGGSSTTAAAPARTATPAHHARGGAVPANAVKLGPSSRLPVGQGATYRDPADGQPDIVIRGSDGKLTAFSAVCTHAGCTVGYQGGQIVCPCHGGTFDAKTGAVTGGPPPSGLARRKVVESGGSVYAVPS
jgi:thiosulfate dehydrogenase [quinone] large subunit